MKTRYLMTAGLLALSFLGGAGEAKAANPAGDLFCREGIRDNEDLAQRIEHALSRNTQDIEGCGAKVQHFLEAFQYHIRKENIDATLNTAAELPAFIRSMEEATAQDDLWFNTDCLWTVNGRTRVKLDCEQRTLKQGERIFGLRDREGNLIVLLYSDCANPGSGEVKIVVTAQPCLKLIFPTTYQGQDVRGAYIGPRPLPGRCHSLIGAGMDEEFSAWPEECPNEYPKVLADGRTVNVTCSWREVEENSTRVMGQPMSVQNVSYSYEARAAGSNVWMLPPEALEGLPTLCWEMPDGSFIALSVSRSSFVDGTYTVTAADMEFARSRQ